MATRHVKGCEMGARVAYPSEGAAVGCLWMVRARERVLLDTLKSVLIEVSSLYCPPVMRVQW